MARDRISTFAQLVSKASSLKITGWSVKYSRESLLECLASIGAIRSFVHYPHLNTTYVDMQLANMKTPSIQQFLAARFPKTKVECEPEDDIQEAESKLEKPETTTFASSKKLFSELAIYTDLKQFGNLRVLNCYYSSIYKKWSCKASFYEQYSIEQLLDYDTSVTRTLCNGKQITYERIGGTRFKAGVYGPIRSNPVHVAQTAFGPVSGEKQQNNTELSQTSLSRIELTEAPSVKSLSYRKSRSTERPSIACLPTYRNFNQSSLCLENALNIYRSRKLEQNTKSVRSKSVSKSLGDQISIELASSRKLASGRRELVVKEYTFEENELLFIQIGKTGNSTYSNVNNVQQICKIEDKKDQLSYLSLDDLSDGYTTIEDDHNECMIIKEETFKVLSAQGLDKDASLVQLTKYSSDAERSFPHGRGSNPQSPSGSHFDNLMGSSSALEYGKVTMVGTSRFGMVGRGQSTHFQDFTFPCY